MVEDEVVEKHRNAFNFLNTKSIHDLRAYGRAIGVRTPTSRKKYELISEIIKKAAASEPKPLTSRRGAPVRAKPVSNDEIEEFYGIMRAEDKLALQTEQNNQVLPDKDNCYVFRGKLYVQGCGVFYVSLEGKIEVDSKLIIEGVKL